MPWHVGIDEAGYGPNLGPLVMSVVACRTDCDDPDVWRLLKTAVRRCDEDDDGRIPVGDSKEVYRSATGLACLEHAVLSFLHGSCCPESRRLGNVLSLLKRLCPSCLDELRNEFWFDGKRSTPVCAEPAGVRSGAASWRRASADAGVAWGLTRCVVVAAKRFNELVERWGTKGSVLGLGWTDLAQSLLTLPGDDGILLVVDKHGGRNHYSVLVQHAFPDGMVLARQEGMECSEYVVMGLPRPVRVVFRPRADNAVFCVALASMVSKYLREVLMADFNCFWQTQVPGVKPTAGYPGDSTRFLNDIRPAMERLGIPMATLWRQR